MLITQISQRFLLLAGFLAAVLSSQVGAANLDVTVRVENLAPTNSISFAPTHVGFHAGIFDAFDIGSAPMSPIISIAEGGSGSDWFPAFAAADPTAVLGTVVANGGPAVPAGNVGGLTNVAENTFRVNTDVNRFFTFANMVVPSNDLFLGNDAAIELFDASGNLLQTEINQFGSSIWNAGSEQAIAANAAFLLVGDNGLRVDENGVVEFSFSELDAYNGLVTAAGYTFDSTLISDPTPIFRISFSVRAVPEPSSALVCAMIGGATVCRRRKR